MKTHPPTVSTSVPPGTLTVTKATIGYADLAFGSTAHVMDVAAGTLILDIIVNATTPFHTAEGTEGDRIEAFFVVGPEGLYAYLNQDAGPAVGDIYYGNDNPYVSGAGTFPNFWPASITAAVMNYKASDPARNPSGDHPSGVVLSDTQLGCQLAMIEGAGVTLLAGSMDVYVITARSFSAP